MHGDRWIEEKVKRLVANELDDMGDGAFQDVDVDLAASVEIAGKISASVLSPKYGKSQAPNVLGTRITWHYLGGNELAIVGRTNDIILTHFEGNGSGGEIKKQGALIGLTFIPEQDIRARSNINLNITQTIAGAKIDDENSFSDNLDKGGFASLKSKTTRKTTEGEDAQDSTTTSNQYQTHEEHWLDILKVSDLTAYTFDSVTHKFTESKLKISFTPLAQDYEASNTFGITADANSNVWSVRVSGEAPVGRFDLWLIDPQFSAKDYTSDINNIQDFDTVWSHTWDSQSARITDYLRSISGAAIDYDRERG